MEHREYLERKDEKNEMRRCDDDSSHSLGVGSVVGGLLLLGVAALVVVSLPDIKRYIKISTM